MQAVGVIDAGNEFRRSVAKLVGAIICVDRKSARRSFPVFRGVSACPKLHGTDSVHAERSMESACYRIADIEAVKQVDRLVFGASCEVDAAGRILDNLRHQ